jgi:hypothetical protein
VVRPSATRSQKRELADTLRVELQRHIERGNCAYCGTAAQPESPLTREHVIPRARGGRRRDVRIIVPACIRCNQHRGCRELIPFLLARPQRITAFLDYLNGLTPESIRQLDVRIFAELFASVAILSDCARSGTSWRSEMTRLCSGRALHRRRYAARRVIWTISERIERRSDSSWAAHGPTCPVPPSSADVLPLHLEEPLERVAARLLSVFALLWSVPAEVIEDELTRELADGSTKEGVEEVADFGEFDSDAEEGVLPLDGWKARSRRKRLRVDRRQGRSARSAAVSRGRAA